MAALKQEPPVNSGPKAKSSLAMVAPWVAKSVYFIYATKQPSRIFSVTTNFMEALTRQLWVKASTSHYYPCTLQFPFPQLFKRESAMLETVN